MLGRVWKFLSTKDGLGAATEEERAAAKLMRDHAVFYTHELMQRGQSLCERMGLDIGSKAIMAGGEHLLSIPILEQLLGRIEALEASARHKGEVTKGE